MPSVEKFQTEYITGFAVVRNFFPDGMANCEHCRFYSFSSRRCNLTAGIPAMPAKFVGQDCPFEFMEGAEHGNPCIDFR